MRSFFTRSHKIFRGTLKIFRAFLGIICRIGLVKIRGKITDEERGQGVVVDLVFVLTRPTRFSLAHLNDSLLFHFIPQHVEEVYIILKMLTSVKS